MGGMTLRQAESYPGELAALRGLYGQLGTIAKHGSTGDLAELLAEHQAAEQDAYAKMPAALRIGPLYGFPTVDDEPWHVGRVLDDGLWWLRRNFGDDEIGRSTADRESFNVHAREGRDVCTVGRLVVHTLNIFEPPTDEEIEKVRKVFMPRFSRGRKAVAGELADAHARLYRSGMHVTVTRTECLRPWPGETYESEA